MGFTVVSLSRGPEATRTHFEGKARPWKIFASRDDRWDDPYTECIIYHVRVYVIPIFKYCILMYILHYHVWMCVCVSSPLQNGHTEFIHVTSSVAACSGKQRCSNPLRPRPLSLEGLGCLEIIVRCLARLQDGSRHRNFWKLYLNLVFRHMDKFIM